MSKAMIENYQNQIQRLQEENEQLVQELQELNDENNSKDEAIQKASMVIQMLREDLEKSVKDLLEIENERDEYKNNLKETQKQLNNLNSSRFKSDMEQQIRQFSQRERDLEQKYEDERETNKLLQQQIDDIQYEIDELIHKNKILNKEVTSLKQELNHYEENEETFKQKCEYKDNQISEKQAVISNLKSSLSELEGHYKNEVNLLKKVIENQNKFKFTTINKTPAQSLTSFNKSNVGTPRKQREGLNETLDQSIMNNKNTLSQKKSNLKKRSVSQQNFSQRKSNSMSMSNLNFEERGTVPTTPMAQNNFKKTNQSIYLNKLDYTQDNMNQYNEEDQSYKQLEMKVKLLETEVQDSLDREKQLIEEVERMVQSEISRVLEYSKDIFNKEVAIRPEVERYLMMIEELQQKVNDSNITSINLSTLLKDSQIIQRLTMKSFIDQKIMFDVFIDKLEQHINQMEIEFLTLAKESRETVYHQCFQDVKNSFGKVKQQIQIFNEQKQKDQQAQLAQETSKESNKQENYSQRNRVDTLVSEAYNQIKEILQGGDYHETHSTPSKGEQTPDYGNSSCFKNSSNNNNNNGNNNNNLLFIRNGDSDQQITFEGRMSTRQQQEQQTSTDQFDFNLHQNLIRRLYSLQEKVKSYEKILDEKFNIDKQGKTREDYLQTRIDELEEEKLFFQVEREKYLLEKEQLIDEIINMERQLFNNNHNNSNNIKDKNQNNTSSLQFSRGVNQIKEGDYIREENKESIQMRERMNELELENYNIKQSNEGLRIEVEQLLIEMKGQQDRIQKLEEEHSQTLAFTDQTIADLDSAIKSNSFLQSENTKLNNIIKIMEKTSAEQREEDIQKEELKGLKIFELQDEINRQRGEVNQKENEIQKLKQKIIETESLIQDYCEIIAASRGTKSEEDRANSYKSSVENILSLLLKSLEQYSLLSSQHFVGNFKPFLEENYIFKTFIQKFTLFKDKISIIFRQIINGLNKICNVIGCNQFTNIPSKSPRLDQSNRFNNSNHYDLSMGMNSNKEYASSFFSKSNTKIQDLNKVTVIELPDSLNEMEIEFEKYTQNLIENYIKIQSNSDLTVKIMKFCRFMNEIAEELIKNSNNSDQIIISKLHRLFQNNNNQKNVIIAEFQLSLMGLLKQWKRAQNESSEIFYQLSFYLKSLIEDNENQQQSQNIGVTKKPDLTKSIQILSSNHFFNEIIENLQNLDKKQLENDSQEQNKLIKENQQLVKYKRTQQKQLKADIESYLQSVDSLQQQTLVLNSHRQSQIQPFIFIQDNHSKTNPHVQILQQFNKFLIKLKELTESKINFILT